MQDLAWTDRQRECIAYPGSRLLVSGPPGYFLAQFAGAPLACLFLWATFGKVGRLGRLEMLEMLGATKPGPGISDWQAIGSGADRDGADVRLGQFGQHHARDGLACLGPRADLDVRRGSLHHSGRTVGKPGQFSIDQSRSLGPNLALLDFSYAWVYLVGPLGGGLLAVDHAHLLRVRGSGIQTAQGPLEEIVVDTVDKVDDGKQPGEPHRHRIAGWTPMAERACDGLETNWAGDSATE